MVDSIFKKKIYSILFVFTIAISANAADISKYETTCTDIGFKKKTEAYADCVLELISRDRRHDKEQELTKQKAFEQEQIIKLQKEAQAKQQLEQQQLTELQRRQALAQEQARQQQDSANGAAALLYILNSGVQGYNQSHRQTNCNSHWVGNNLQTYCY